MPWTNVMTIWAQLIDQMCEDFPYLEKAALVRFRGDRDKFVTYLAETHDLTLNEADELLQDWVDFIATRVEIKLAA